MVLWIEQEAVDGGEPAIFDVLHHGDIRLVILDISASIASILFLKESDRVRSTESNRGPRILLHRET